MRGIVLRIFLLAYDTFGNIRFYFTRLTGFLDKILIQGIWGVDYIYKIKTLGIEVPGGNSLWENMFKTSGRK